VLDRNNAVSAAYARATGYLARLASDKQLLRLSTYSKDLYLNAEDETRRQVAADIIYAVSKFATDRFNALASDFLPFIFFARHDFDEHVKEQFEKTWSENVGGSRVVLLYFKEINSLSIQHLESPKWTIKHTAALTIADVVASSGAEISLENSIVIWPVLEKALALKTFDGKEKVLDAFVKFTKAAKLLWEKESGIAAQMKKIAIREAKRNNSTYRPRAFISLGEYSEARTDLDMFDEVYNIVAPMLEKLTSEDKMDTSEDNDKGGSSNDTATITAGLTALFRAINVKRLNPSPLTHLPRFLKAVQDMLASPKSTTVTRIALYERAKALFDSLRKMTHTQSSSYYELALGFFKVLEIPSGSGSEAIRMKRSEAAEMIAMAFVSGAFGMFREGREGAKESMRELVAEGKANERATLVLGMFDKVVKALEE